MGSTTHTHGPSAPREKASEGLGALLQGQQTVPLHEGWGGHVTPALLFLQIGNTTHTHTSHTSPPFKHPPSRSTKEWPVGRGGVFQLHRHSSQLQSPNAGARINQLHSKAEAAGPVCLSINCPYFVQLLNKHAAEPTRGRQNNTGPDRICVPRRNFSY